jgi:hypothetical protein
MAHKVEKAGWPKLADKNQSGRFNHRADFERGTSGDGRTLNGRHRSAFSVIANHEHGGKFQVIECRIKRHRLAKLNIAQTNPEALPILVALRLKKQALAIAPSATLASASAKPKQCVNHKRVVIGI